jgi:outer membrane protein OmpA-like peptidoglycan-associated protein
MKTLTSTIRPRLALVVLLGAAASACASTPPPKELQNARASYDAAKGGQAARLDPTALQTAAKSLDTAERSYLAEGDTNATRDLAYVAKVRAQIADARAGERVANIDRGRSLAMLESTRAQQLQVTSAQLESTRGQLQAEQQRREEAERREKQAMADLGRLGTVKRDTRGMVLTLSGSVLFASGKSSLLPSAQAKLGQVASVLANQDKDVHHLVVEGYTDAQGSDEFNQKLSEKRAEAVRDYLVSHGISQDRVSAKGLGESNPIADNNTAEGRANNRRVEIVVPPEGSQGGPSTTKP